MGRRTVQDAVVDDIEKWRYPTKHYVYVIHVSWSDGSVNVVYRRYSKFFDFQMKLLSLFPQEAGAKNPTQRMIPFLPGKKLFGRSHTREVASKRLVQLNEYCRALVRLPAKVSDSNTVLEFFTPTIEDINPKKYGNPDKKAGREIDVISDPIQPDPYIVLAEYTKQQKNEVDLHAGDTVDVFEKTESGWWFVSTRDGQGWAPASFLNREDGAEDEDAFAVTDERYITNNSYKAQQADEITFERGVIVTVVQKSLDGWWKVSFTDNAGWAPAAFLQVYTGPSDVVAGAPTERVGNVMSVSDIFKRRLASESSGASPQPLRKNDSPIHYGTEAKPTPPRRNTVRPDNGNDLERTIRKGATRKRNPPTKKSPKQYYTTGDFTDSEGGSLDFKRGEQVQVIQETESGWWLVRIGDREGWAPSTFIEAQEERVAETRPQQPRSDVMDEETGESSPRPPRPAVPPVRETSTETANVGANAFRPVPLPPGRSGNSGSNSASGSNSSSDKSAFRPVPVKPGSSNNNSNSSNSSAFRPVPVPSINAGRPLPSKPVRKSPAGSPNLRSAQANLKPTSAKAKPPVVNRNQKPVIKPAAKARANQPSQVNELKNQLEKMHRSSSGVKQASVSYVTAASYQDSSGEGLSFDKGLDVEVVEENDSGWWLVRIGGEEGWAPSNYLDKV